MDKRVDHSVMPRYQLRNLLLGLLSAVCLGFTGVVAFVLITQPTLFQPPIGGPFALADLDGKRVTEADFAGRYRLIYFGYTYCPDVCPTELIEMTHALEAFEQQTPEAADQVTPIFITVDPGRDTPAALRAYMAHFHPRFVALSGSEEEIAAAAQEFRVTYRKIPGEDGQDYLLDHTAYVFLMGPDGRYLTHFTAQEDTAAMTRQLARLVQ